VTVSAGKYRGDNLAFGAIVLMIGSTVRIGASIYLPALPIIGENLQITDAMMSNTLTLYFVIFALFILVSGALSDAYGRRIVLQSGMFFFIAGSVICAMACSYETLMVGRGVQAFGASMIPGTLMAMVRDACSDTWVVSLMGWLAVLGGLFLVAAPLIGGILTHFFGWTSNFWFLAILTTGAWITVYLKVKETHPVDKRTPFGFQQTFSTAGTILRSGDFILVMLPVIAYFALQGAFLAAAPYVIMGIYKLSPVEFGLSNIVIVIGLFSGRSFGFHLLKKCGIRAVYRFSGISSVVISVLYGAMATNLIDGLAWFLGVISLFGAIFGMLSPVGMKSSLSAFRANSGVAASMQGALLIGASAIGSAAIGGMLDIFPTLDTETSFALVSSVLCLSAGTGAIMSCKRLQ